ncbi:hypothetical protein [Kitasatospora sp. NPDC004289]
MPHPFRRTTTALALLLALGTATGCTPPLGHSVGIVTEGGVASAVTALCPGGVVRSAHVHETGGEADLWWIAHPAPGSGPVDRIPLLAGPPGWVIEEATLTALLPDRRYGLTVAHTGGAAKDSSLVFGLSDLEGLKPGQVLTWKKGGGTRVVTVDEFRAAATRDC